MCKPAVVEASRQNVCIIFSFYRYSAFALSSACLKNSKPAVENIIKVINKLKSKGFTEIPVTSDASFHHRISDKERLTELESSCTYFTAPAKTTADIFLIEFVKTNG